MRRVLGKGSCTRKQLPRHTSCSAAGAEMVTRSEQVARVERKRRKTTEGGSEGEGRREHTKGINGSYYASHGEDYGSRVHIYIYVSRTQRVKRGQRS